ncbi:MAG: transposase [Treponema sp.]|jgi:transposase InsO family protein|nr:transposase [Treponema sp.]
MASESHNETLFGPYARRMRDAAAPEERNAVVQEMCRMFAISKAKAYKMLHQCGWESGRKPRRDAGTSSVDGAALNKLAALMWDSKRKNGKVELSVSDARAILQANGVDIPVSDSQLRDLLRRNKLSARYAKQAKPHQRMRSEYPNQVHMADPSLCLLYYTPNGEQHVLRDDEVYKNKPFLEGREDLKCWRYVLTDHFSATICVRYYAAKGEKAENMYDFLLYAWGKKTNPVYGFHGLPEILVWDCGSANKAKAVTRALAAFRVKTMPHLPGNPRGKGQVERSNDLVEHKFESRLRIEPVNSVDELNEAAERWCAAFNADSIENTDSRLTRGRRVVGVRYNLWNSIPQDKLRELPDPEICRQVFTTGIQGRKVAGDLTVSLLHPKTKRVEVYSLAGRPGIITGQTVNVQPVLVDPEPLAIVSYEEQRGKVVSAEVRPIEWDRAGFDADAPVFGKAYKRPPDTRIETNGKELARVALELQGTLKAHSFIKAVNPFARQRTGEQIAVAQPDQVQIHDILISHFEAAKQVRARNGWVSESFIGRMKTAYPGGVPSSLVDDIAHDEAGADAALSM